LVDAVWSKNACGFTPVVFEEAPKPFTTPYRAFMCCVLTDSRKEQHIALTLMIPLLMIMVHILVEHMPQGDFAEQDHPGQRFIFNRAHPPLREGIQIRRPRWQGHSLHPGRIDELLKGGAVFPVPIMDEVLSGREETPLLHRDVARDED
jgi:hypothetical protein